MYLKYMKVSLFEISYKKNFFTIFIFFLDVPVYLFYQGVLAKMAAQKVLLKLKYT